MNARELALFGLMLAFFGMLLAWASAQARQRFQLRKQRLDVLQQALQHGALDELTRAELVRVLAREHERSWNPWKVVRAVWFGSGWSAFIVAGGMLLASAARIVRGVDVPIVLPIALVGFAMVTLPLAWNELTFRRPQPASR